MSTHGPTTGSGVATEDFNTPWRHCRTLQCLLITRQMLWTTRAWPKRYTTTAPLIQCLHTSLQLLPCTTKPGITTCSRMLQTRGCWVLPYWSQSIKSGKDDCFFKHAYSYTMLKGSSRIRETWLCRMYIVTLSTWPQRDGGPGIDWQKIQSNCFKEAQRAIREHR